MMWMMRVATLGVMMTRDHHHHHHFITLINYNNAKYQRKREMLSARTWPKSISCMVQGSFRVEHFPFSFLDFDVVCREKEAPGT
jgi:hypothetical protein